MIRAKTNLKLEVFLHKLKVTEQDYSKRHSKYNFKASNISFRVTKFEISSSVLLNSKLLSLFKTKIKDRLLKLKIISNDFQYLLNNLIRLTNSNFLCFEALMIRIFGFLRSYYNIIHT